MNFTKWIISRDSYKLTHSLVRCLLNQSPNRMNYPPVLREIVFVIHTSVYHPILHIDLL